MRGVFSAVLALVFTLQVCWADNLPRSLGGIRLKKRGWPRREIVAKGPCVKFAAVAN